MKKVSALAGLVLLGLLSCLSLAAAQPVLNDPEEFLTGFWTTGEASPDRTCDPRHRREGGLIEFDFGESGGRLVSYHIIDADIFEPIVIMKAEEDMIFLDGSRDDGSPMEPTSLRVLSDNSFELRAAEDEPGTYLFHRCHMPEEEYEPLPPREPELAPRPVPDPS